jgi:hypothetical protein
MNDLEELPLFQPTTLQRRILDAAADIMEVGPETPEFLHAVLCQVGLPRSKVEGRIFERTSGKAALRLEAGGQYLGKRGGFKELPLPYGSRPRLVLYHLCSEAVRTRSREIDIGRSLAAFLEKLDLCTSGQEYTRFKNQMTALCGVRMILGYSDAGRSLTINTVPVHRFDAWTHYDGRQLGFWPGYLELSTEFYETLVEHAVPLDPRAIHALKHAALALDIYTWLAHRLCRIRKPGGVKLSWANLREQFGQEYGSSKDFKKEFRAGLRKVLTVYHDATIGEEPGGLRLYSSPPPVRKTKVVVPLIA